MKKKLFALFILVTVVMRPLSADDRFSYDGVFNGPPKDDGKNNFEIALILFQNVDRYASDFNLSENKNREATEAALLIDSMLQLRAFADQRAGEIKLSEEQREKLRLVKESLSQLELSYHQNERQELYNLCVKKPEVIDKIRPFLALKLSK